MIAGIILLATVAIHPSTRLARRFLERHVPADVLADARSSSGDDEEGADAVSPRAADVSPPEPVGSR
ncbi:hypothetical protein ACFQZ4_53885 [Catellatospora coxensis]